MSNIFVYVSDIYLKIVKCYLLWSLEVYTKRIIYVWNLLELFWLNI